MKPKREHAQRLLAHALDVLLRLLHPLMPFITEEMWHNLNLLAPSRGLKPPARERVADRRAVARTRPAAAR